MRLIDADALEQELLAIRKRIVDKAEADLTWFQTGACVGLEAAGQCISKASTTDAVPVRRGKWLDVCCAVKCSCCDETYSDEIFLMRGKINYYPNCGAKLKEVKNDDII